MPPYDPKIITVDHTTMIERQALKELAFDLNLALRKELRPARLKEMLKRDPMDPLYDDRNEKRIAEVLVQAIERSNWYVIRKPSSPMHSAPPPFNPVKDNKT